MTELEKRKNMYLALTQEELITLCIKRKDKIDNLRKENEKYKEMYEKLKKSNMIENDRKSVR